VNFDSTPFHALPDVKAVLNAERGRIAAAAARRPRGRARVLQACADNRSLELDTRHLEPVRQHVDGLRLSGDVACEPAALAWEDAAFQLVVAQHAGESLPASDGLLRELIRVLAPGGVMLWFGLNPYSPWLARLRWAGRSGPVRPPRTTAAGVARRQLMAGHLVATRVDWLGPMWRTDSLADAHPSAAAALRAAYLVSAIRQQSAPIPLRLRRPRTTAAVASPLPLPSRRARA
jgi:SAM-dependent methyltransferase